jgi:hypothetical protein
MKTGARGSSSVLKKRSAPARHYVRILINRPFGRMKAWTKGCYKAPYLVYAIDFFTAPASSTRFCAGQPVILKASRSAAAFPGTPERPYHVSVRAAYNNIVYVTAK